MRSSSSVARSQPQTLLLCLLVLLAGAASSVLGLASCARKAQEKGASKLWREELDTRSSEETHKARIKDPEDHALQLCVKITALDLLSRTPLS